MLRHQDNTRAQRVVNEFLEQVNAKVAAGDITMSELARRAGVARPYLYRVLSGEQTPSLDVAERIALAVGLVLKICALSA